METHRFILFQFILVNISISNTFLFAFYDCRAGCTRCAASHSVWTHAQIWTWTHSFLQTKWIFGWVYSANWAAEIKWARIYTIRCSHKDTHYYIVATHSFNETWNSVRWKKKKKRNSFTISKCQMTFHDWVGRAKSFSGQKRATIYTCVRTKNIQRNTAWPTWTWTWSGANRKDVYWLLPCAIWKWLFIILSLRRCEHLQMPQFFVIICSGAVRRTPPKNTIFQFKRSFGTHKTYLLDVAHILGCSLLWLLTRLKLTLQLHAPIWCLCKLILSSYFHFCRVCAQCSAQWLCIWMVFIAKQTANDTNTSELGPLFSEANLQCYKYNNTLPPIHSDHSLIYIVLYAVAYCNINCNLRMKIERAAVGCISSQSTIDTHIIWYIYCYCYYVFVSNLVVACRLSCYANKMTHIWKIPFESGRMHTSFSVDTWASSQLWHTYFPGATHCNE